VVEVSVVKAARKGVDVALVGGDAAPHTGGDFPEILVNADARDVLSLLEIGEQFAAPAAEVEHMSAGLHPLADDFHIDGAFLGGQGHCFGFLGGEGAEFRWVERSFGRS